MSEFRQNISTGEWVIIAPERKQRPDDYQRGQLNSIRPHSQETHSPTCPFCPGNEHKCQPPVLEVCDSNSWSLRVVPNIFAAVSNHSSPQRQRVGLHLMAGGYGQADVLIESPLHNADLSTMPLKQVESILQAYRLRYISHSADPHINIVNIFRNHGGSAGASLKHPHSQIISCLVAPPHVTDQIDYARRSFSSWGNCVYCALINDELNQKVRIIDTSEHFVALCPFASKSPYEIRIYPLRHCSIFGDIRDHEIEDFAQILQNTLAKLARLLHDPDYNFYIRSVTTSEGFVHFYHWYLTIIPKTSHHAGFELGTGIYINTSSPEQCAQDLREA